MNSAEVRTLKNELERFEPKPCRTCQLVFGLGVLVFLISITLFLFAQKGVSPSSVIPIAPIPREKPLSRADEVVIMDELRGLSEEHKRNVPSRSIESVAEHPTPKKKIPIEIITP